MATWLAADVVRAGLTVPAAHDLPRPVRLAAALAPLREGVPPEARTHVRIMPYWNALRDAVRAGSQPSASAPVGSGQPGRPACQVDALIISGSTEFPVS